MKLIINGESNNIFKKDLIINSKSNSLVIGMKKTKRIIKDNSWCYKKVSHNYLINNDLIISNLFIRTKFYKLFYKLFFI